jgi:hypothetical protein
MTAGGGEADQGDKVQYFKELAGRGLGSAGSGFSSGDALGAKIPIQCVDCRVQNEVAVRTVFQVALDLSFDGSREATF